MFKIFYPKYPWVFLDIRGYIHYPNKKQWISMDISIQGSVCDTLDDGTSFSSFTTFSQFLIFFKWGRGGLHAHQIAGKATDRLTPLRRHLPISCFLREPIYSGPLLPPGDVSRSKPKRLLIEKFFCALFIYFFFFKAIFTFRYFT